MATVVSLIDDIRPLIAGGVPEVTFTWAIVDAARDFCEFARYLRETRVYDAVADQRYYTIAPSLADTEIIEVKALQYSDRPLTPTSFEDTEQLSGSALGWIFEPPNQIWPTPTPTVDTTDGLAVRMILKPTVSATTLPEYILRKHRDTITEGALVKIFLMKDAPWYSVADAGIWEAKFERRKLKARSEADRVFRPRAFHTLPPQDI